MSLDPRGGLEQSRGIAPDRQQAPMVRAVAFNGANKAYAQQLPAEVWREVVSTLSPATRALLDLPPSASEWVPLEHGNEVREAVFRIACRGDTEQMFELGRRCFDLDNRLFLRIVFRLFSAEVLLPKLMAITKQRYRGGRGRMEVITRPRMLEMRSFESPTGSMSYWHMTRGYLCALIERMTSSKDVRATAEFDPKQPKDCVLKVTW